MLVSLLQDSDALCSPWSRWICRRRLLFLPLCAVHRCDAACTSLSSGAVTIVTVSLPSSPHSFYGPNVTLICVKNSYHCYPTKTLYHPDIRCSLTKKTVYITSITSRFVELSEPLKEHVNTQMKLKHEKHQNWRYKVSPRQRRHVESKPTCPPVDTTSFQLANTTNRSVSYISNTYDPQEHI